MDDIFESSDLGENVKEPGSDSTAGTDHGRTKYIPPENESSDIDRTGPYHSRYDSYRFQTPQDLKTVPTAASPQKPSGWKVVLLIIALAALILAAGFFAYQAVTGKSLWNDMQQALNGVTNQDSGTDRPEKRIVLGAPKKSGAEENEAGEKNTERQADPGSGASPSGAASQGSYIGVTCMTMPEAYTNEGYPVGVYVMVVNEGGPAAKAGIQEGDILTSLDGAQLQTKEDLIELLTKYAGGDEVGVTLRRYVDDKSDFDDVTVTVILGDRSEMKETLSEETPAEDTPAKEPESREQPSEEMQGEEQPSKEAQEEEKPSEDTTEEAVPSAESRPGIPGANYSR